MKIQIALAASFFALLPAAASAAENQDEQNACMGDAFSVCSHAIPDREKVATCLALNIARISAPCRTVMNGYSKQPPVTRAKISSRD